MVMELVVSHCLNSTSSSSFMSDNVLNSINFPFLGHIPYLPKNDSPVVDYTGAEHDKAHCEKYNLFLGYPREFFFYISCTVYKLFSISSLLSLKV